MNATLTGMGRNTNDSLNLTLDVDGSRISMVVTTTTPGASDGLGESEPIIVIWDGATEPVARVALTSRKVATGWEPFNG